MAQACFLLSTDHKEEILVPTERSSGLRGVIPVFGAELGTSLFCLNDCVCCQSGPGRSSFSLFVKKDYKRAANNWVRPITV